SRNQHSSARADLGRNCTLPVRDDTRDRVLEGLRQRQFGGGERRVPWIAGWTPRIVRRERRRRNIVGATPPLDLSLDVLRSSFSLVQPLQRAVMTFVEAPVLRHRNP